MIEKPILIIGGNGQIGSELGTYLSSYLDPKDLIISDLADSSLDVDSFTALDILDYAAIENAIKRYKIKTVINLAAVLSAKGESSPELAWKVNVDGLLNLLNLAKIYDFSIFHPSSIAVFGLDDNKRLVSQDHPLHPQTIYGASKVAGESLCLYYHYKYKVDVRSIRLPGVISAYSRPGGGTTDYAVDIYHQAVLKGSYACFLEEHTTLPMIFMDDAIQAIVDIMSTPSKAISIRYGYNINGLSINPKDISESIKKYIPEFELSFNIDFRQDIANSWPESVDDTLAVEDWAWNAKISLDKMTKIMIESLRKNTMSK